MVVDAIAIVAASVTATPAVRNPAATATATIKAIATVGAMVVVTPAHAIMLRVISPIVIRAAMIRVVATDVTDVTGIAPANVSLIVNL
jgi:hypothetical protein